MRCERGTNGYWGLCKRGRLVQLRVKAKLGYALVMRFWKLCTYLVGISLRKSATNIRCRWLLCHRRRHRCGDRSLSFTLALVVTVGGRRRRKVAHRR